jgi:predicted nucleic acid-binding protein
MVLVDTSVWVAHFRSGRVGLEFLLDRAEIACHRFVIGELACGTFRQRVVILDLLRALPEAPVADHEEVLLLIEKRRLMGRGIGYVDAHLLCSCVLADLPLWTMDKKLAAIAADLGCGFKP